MPYLKSAGCLWMRRYRKPPPSTNPVPTTPLTASELDVVTQAPDKSKWTTAQVAEQFAKADTPGALTLAYFEMRGLAGFTADPETMRESKTWRTGPDKDKEWTAVLFASTDENGVVVAVQAIP